MSRRISRRRFLKAGAAAGTFLLVAPGVARTFAANEKLDMAAIGAGGQAAGGVGTALGQNCIAVAEVDLKGRGKKMIDKVRKEAPGAQIYTDFRKLFDAHPKLDAVWIGTPDHTHFPATVRAMAAGAGVYCEKPLTHNVQEARILRQLAATYKAPTQMGNQGHSSESIRRLCEYVWAGRLGDVTRVDAVSNRNFSAKGRPDPSDPPAGMDWQAWVGPAPFRAYHGGLHPFSWRGWLDFGTGSLGDMGCHTLDAAVWALKLDEAETCEVEAPEGKPTKEGFPPRAKIIWRFPARGAMPPVTVTWYHGGLMPPRPEALEENRKLQSQGAYYYGSKAVAQTGSHAGGFRIIPESQHRETEVPPITIPRVQGGHGGDFIRACKAPDGLPPSSHFTYAARLTEIIHLGNVACLAGEPFAYDFRTGTASGAKASDHLARPPRDGWERGYA